MKKLFSIISLLLVAGAFFTCKKSHKSDVSQPKDSLYEASAAVQAILETIPSSNVDLNSIVLPNGSRVLDFELTYDKAWLSANKDLLPAKYQTLLNAQLRTEATTGNSAPLLGPQAIKNRLIAREQCIANYLVTRSNFVDLVKNKPDPQQNGLAYVYGSGDYTQLTRSAGKCSDQLYGLDCSGMLRVIMSRAGLPVQGNSPVLALNSTWTTVIKAAGKSYDNIFVQNYTSKDISAGEIISGDIVYFYGYDDYGNYGIVHIGIALADAKGTVKLYQSNGRASSNCPQNYDDRHGPRILEVDNPIKFKDAWGFKDYGVLRLSAKISGDWNAYVKCGFASTDAITLKLKFSTVENGNYTATGSGTDYSGEPINVTVKGYYDVSKATLTGTIVYSFPTNPDEKRSDSFNINLGYDDTGYSNLTKVVDNGGCAAQIRLVNLQSTKVDNESKTQTINSNPGSDCHCSLSAPSM